METVSRVTGLLAAALGTVAAHAAVQAAAVSPYTFTPRRTGASLSVLIALIAAIAGGRALARGASGTGTGYGRRGAVIALVLASIGVLGGGLVLATAKGGLGTGNGLGGGVVAVTMGLIGIALGGLALARTQRASWNRR